MNTKQALRADILAADIDNLAAYDALLEDLRRAVTEAQHALEAAEFARDQAVEYALGNTLDAEEANPDEQETQTH